MKKILLFLSIVMLTLSACKDECKDVLCLNDGVCLEGSCFCPTGYSGTNCEIIDPCLNVSCGDNGVCVDGTCECLNGYFGEECDQIDPCYNVSCGENGECNDGTCECENNYEGTNCENTAATKFLGTWDIVCNGTLNIDGTNENFVNSPGTAKIYQGENPDEIVLYVQLDEVTDAIPMTVEAYGEVNELEYETDVESQTINAEIGGIFTINLNYTIKAEGELNDDMDELDSTVTFNGDLSGIITCTGEKQ